MRGVPRIIHGWELLSAVPLRRQEWSMMLLGRPLDVRERFIARHGLTPWGMIAGAVAAIIAVSGLHHAASTTAVILVAVVAFTMWAALVTWAVGALLWELR